MQKYLSEDATKVLVHAFVTSDLDYCNSLLYGIPKCQHGLLQRILNAAACIVCVVSKFSHITPLLCNLHWLPVPYWIQFKIFLLVHRALFGVSPVYLKKLLSFKESGPYNLRSNTSYEIKCPPNKVQDLWEQGLRSCRPLTVEHSSFSYQEYPECSGFQSGSKDLYHTFLLCFAFAQ